jgi:MFS family permease
VTGSADIDARRQRLFVGLAGVTRFMAGILMGTAMAVYVGRSGSEFAVSMVLAAYSLGMTFFAPTWGAIADVTGRRRAVMVVAGVAATLAVLPLAVVGDGTTPVTLFGLVVQGVWPPILLRGLYAAFATGMIPVMLAIVSDMGGEEGRGRSLGFFNAARGAGFAGGQLLIGFLLGILAPSGLYLFVAAVSLASAGAAAMVKDPTPTPDESPTVGEVLAEVRRRLLPAVDDRAHLHTNGLRWLYVALALRNMTVMGVMSLMPVYLTGPIGVSEAVMGILLAINPAGQTVFMLLFGRIADAAGRKPLIVGGMAGSGLFGVLAAAAMIPGGTPISAGLAGVAVSGPLGRIAVAAVAFVVIAAAFSAMTTGALAFIGDVAPADRESELMGLRSTAKGVGGVVGPPILGGIATFLGIQAAFAIGSVLAFSAAGLAATALVESRETSGRRFVPGDD